ncbi:HNH endonuclease [Paracoccus sulfuroxidans]|nr:HNH endonuclease [Paracoccus sulfuroxidans]
MVGSRGAARKKYDEIKLLAHDECPYCGGCGELVEEEGIGTIDHFLPKARFPIFSIVPANLVPACGTCNTGMGSRFPTAPELQPLHPYFDAPHFFDEKWTTATVSEEEPVMVTFDVNPPAAWSENDRQRVVQHFKSCKLRGRYRTKVASDLSSIIAQRKTVHRDLSPEAFREVLKAVADNELLPINGWKRSLYYGLADSVWFCANNFAA